MKAKTGLFMLLIGMISITGFGHTPDPVQNSEPEYVVHPPVAADYSVNVPLTADVQIAVIQFDSTSAVDAVLSLAVVEQSFPDTLCTAYDVGWQSNHTGASSNYTKRTMPLNYDYPPINRHT